MGGIEGEGRSVEVTIKLRKLYEIQRFWYNCIENLHKINVFDDKSLKTCMKSMFLIRNH